MTLSPFEELNRILAIIDSCQTDCEIDFAFNLPKEFYDLANPKNEKGLAVKNFVDNNFHFRLTEGNKEDLIKTLATNFDDGEICHYAFFKNSVKIGEGFDYAEINTLNPRHFKLTPEHLELLGDVEIIFSDRVD